MYIPQMGLKVSLKYEFKYSSNITKSMTIFYMIFNPRSDLMDYFIVGDMNL